jgi:hypothetical protein
MPYQTVNPFNGEALRTFDEHTDQRMEQMLAAADQTFRDVWSRKSVRQRAEVIGKAASLLLDQKEMFAGLSTLEMGKRIAESRGEVELTASILKYYADNAETFLARRTLSTIAGEAHIEYSPLGVLVGVQPWNYERARARVMVLLLRYPNDPSRVHPRIRIPAFLGGLAKLNHIAQDAIQLHLWLQSTKNSKAVHCGGGF